MHAGKLKVFGPEEEREDGMRTEKLRGYPGENNRLTWKERPDATTNTFGHQFPLQRIQCSDSRDNIQDSRISPRSKLEL